MKSQAYLQLALAAGLGHSEKEAAGDHVVATESGHPGHDQCCPWGGDALQLANQQANRGMGRPAGPLIAPHPWLG